MPTLVVALRSEVRRLASREIRKALKPLRKVQHQLHALRLVSRGTRRNLSRLERKVATLKARAGNLRGGTSQAGPRMSPESLRSLRARHQMTREQFAGLLGVSPGSIFGWETGRTNPRGRSWARILEVRKMGVRAVQAKLKRSRGRGRSRRP